MTGRELAAAILALPNPDLGIQPDCEGCNPVDVWEEFGTIWWGRKPLPQQPIPQVASTPWGQWPNGAIRFDDNGITALMTIRRPEEKQ